MSGSPAIDVADLRFSYGSRAVLSIERCRLARGDSMAVIGPSGCGKTTFLHLLAGLIRPGSGAIEILGQDLSVLGGADLDRFRGQHIGLVFQRFHLLPALTVRDNVLLAQRLARAPIEPAAVEALFDRLDLAGLEHRKPSTLSQGQAQRSAIARALVHGPELVMADEPTSALDDRSAERALALLKESAQAVGAALVVVTHDQRVRGRLDIEFEMEAQP
ncbi:MAG: ATP-binding cassette domain-containing protein [Gammaproteobacteria bacterium]|nr:ATP-binding cassette domain-containing protein [Gammaproteobacteria bacterium]